MIEDVKPYLCSREVCISSIQDSINQYSRKELANILSTSDAVKISKCVIGVFCDVNYDRNGKLVLFDEIDPKGIAKYIMENKQLNANAEIVYAFVCRTQMKLINAYYKELRKGNLPFKIGKNIPDNIEKCEKEYIKVGKERIKNGVVQLRGV